MICRPDIHPILDAHPSALRLTCRGGEIAKFLGGPCGVGAPWAGVEAVCVTSDVVTSVQRKHGRMDMARLFLGDGAITQLAEQFDELLVN
jgi:hypothetical protein